MPIYFVQRGACRPPAVLDARDPEHAQALADARKGLKVRELSRGDTVFFTGDGDRIAFGRLAEFPRLGSWMFIEPFDHARQAFLDKIPVASSRIFDVDIPLTMLDREVAHA